MKRLLIGLGALLALSMAAPNAMSQQRRGNGGSGQSRGSGGVAIQTQTRTGSQGRGRNAIEMHSQSNTQTRAGNQGQGRRGDQSRQPTGNFSVNSGSPDLLRMREEEKLARDVYTKLAKTSSLPIFRNISRAESQHMQAIDRLVRGGGGNVLNDMPGVFAFADYQQLYDSLVATGSRSPLDAVKVGAKIEEMDIADLRQMLNQTSDPQVRQVLQHLLQGSQNHLRAFASQLARQGASYNAEFLSQADFDQIANPPEQRQQSRRGGNAGGQGSQNRGNGLGFGSQGQSSVGQGLGGHSRSRAKQGSGG
ncbi:hypothetical protein Poly51_45440 [Rubripirellula tenax]|uniref:DUF2202 domain-containing protein n=1 Tax=Rubripirellula tenax TaxID=2528015 RepID=A0A5C6EFS9_9BACT|nr:DUF2202 domain-containing protein [Rubripirellula tenax]TWU48643.1 hypothetical protein Poly51_45440 [Rubripirellula tenax]